MEDFVKLARSITGGLHDVISELNAKALARAEELMTALDGGQAPHNPPSSSKPTTDRPSLRAEAQRYVAAQDAQNALTELLQILIDPQYMGHAVMVVSAHKIEMIRGLISRLRVTYDVAMDEQQKLIEAQLSTASVSNITVKELQAMATEEPRAAPLMMRWMSLIDATAAREFLWGEYTPAAWAVPTEIVPGDNAVFDIRGVLDAEYMVERGYDKLGDEVGLCPAVIERMMTIKIGEAGIAGYAGSDGFAQARARYRPPEASEPHPLKPWGDAQIATLKTMAEKTNAVAEGRNQSRLTEDALIEMQQKAVRQAQLEREQHRGVQREKAFAARNPLDTMIVKSLPDLLRFATVSNYYESLMKLRKSHREAVLMMLEHKSFSGADVPLSALYEETARRLGGGEWDDVDEFDVAALPEEYMEVASGMVETGDMDGEPSLSFADVMRE